MLTEEEQEFLIQNPVFTYAVETDYVPVEYLDNKGQPQGIGVAYLDFASELLNVEFELIESQENLSWEDNLRLMKEGKIDLLPTATYTKERSAYMDFTHPHYVENMIIVGRMGSDVVVTIDDLNAKKLCFAKGHWQVDYFNSRLNDPLIYESTTVRDVLNLIDKGKMDYTVIDENVYVHYLQDSKLSKLSSVGYINLNAEHRMGISKSLPILRGIIDKVIQRVPKSDVYKKAFTMNSIAEEKQRVFIINMSAIIIVIIVLISLVFVRIRHLHYKRKILESRTALIENLSHDLKTPLSTLRANIGLMKHGMISEEQTNKYYSKLDQNIERMNYIIEELYKLSGEKKETYNQDNSENVEMKNWLYEIYIVHKVRFNESLKDLNFSYENDGCDVCVMTIKRGLMERAVENLLSNALKFSSDKSQTHLILKSSKTKIEIIVANHGDGIALSEQKLIFERFYQSKVDHLNPGKGLGLSIANEIVQNHGGRIFVDSKLNGITKFTIELHK